MALERRAVYLDAEDLMDRTGLVLEVLRDALRTPSAAVGAL